MASTDKFHNEAFVTALQSKEKPVSSVVREFTLPLNAANSSSDYEKSLWASWHDLTTLARQTPHFQQERIVAFIDEVRKQSGPVNEDGKKGKVWGEEVEWESLPVFGAEVRECWNFAPKDEKEVDENWINLNAFVARLTAISTPGDSRDFSLYGIWTMRDALEDSNPQDSLPNLSVLQAAAIWMIYASPILRERAEKKQSFDGKMGREGKSLGEKGWTGYSMARWDLWRERLVMARDRCEDRETKELLAKAVSCAEA